MTTCGGAKRLLFARNGFAKEQRAAVRFLRFNQAVACA
jgi:hypothetical protein